VDVLTGEGVAATFTGSFAGAGTYTARVDADGTHCATAMTGSHNVVAYSAITAGAIESGSKTTDAGTNPDVIVQNSLEASGGSGNLTYEWRRTTGTGDPVTVIADDNATSYTIASSDYSSAGTYYFNRYAKDKACATAVWVAATGTYTLYVESVGINQPQGGCTFTQPPLVGTFANFHSTSAYSSSTYVTLTDARDSKNYAVVKIGGRWIMAQNLNYQTGLTWQANSNSPSTGSGSNKALIGHFWCPGGYSSSTGTSTRASCDVWGALYSWETAMSFDGLGSWKEVATYNTGAANATNAKINHGRTSTGGIGGRGICPPNWHVPTDNEWGIILDGMESGGGTAHQNAASTGWYGSNAGLRGKSKCTCPSATPSANCLDDTNANWYYNAGTIGADTYALRVLPAGIRSHDGASYWDRGLTTYFWTSTPLNAAQAYDRAFAYNTAQARRYTSYGRSYGMSVRCIRDL
jgi:uncharacterized protein (TIGR02145 family)